MGLPSHVSSGSTVSFPPTQAGRLGLEVRILRTRYTLASPPSAPISNRIRQSEKTWGPVPCISLSSIHPYKIQERREREREMTMDREREREMELECAMYTNCLLLGLDPSIIGIGGSNGTPRVGLFRHSNPRMGEQLLYFILSALRGPTQSAKDFDKVWPIFDSAQSRDFRKIVHGIINELESQGALPRSNSRVSSLATCCGQRFVELLWQLSLHALREVHRRTFPADVASNPLPASLTDVSYSHAATLLPVTKARIALERRKFIKNANAAVHRQATWSSLAHDITAEFRGLCAEEAYLQQELEKLQDLRSKAKLEGEPWDDRLSNSLGQNSHLVSKATRLWESLLSRKSHHEVLASGPIEDLIAHREHRYRISGSSLLAAMDQSSHVPHPDVLSIQPSDLSSADTDGQGQIAEPFINMNREKAKNSLDSTHSKGNDETLPRVDDRSGRVHPSVDIAEVLRRWTHALQRIHKQSLHLAKTNDGEGPELLRCASDSGSSGHAESLAATLAEHRQHLASIQVFINQLKEMAPAMEESIMELTDEVNSISPVVPMVRYDGRSMSPIQAQSSGRDVDNSMDEVGEVTSKFSSIQLEKISTSPALKLPHLFSMVPNSSTKAGNAQKQHAIAPQANQVEYLPEGKMLDQPLSNGHVDNPVQDSNNSYVQNIRRSVREVALSVQSNNLNSSQDNSNDSAEHFFVPLSTSRFVHMGADTKPVANRSKQRLFVSPPNSSVLKTVASKHNANGSLDSKVEEVPDVLEHSSFLNEYDNQVDGFLSGVGSNHAACDTQRMFYNMEDAQDQVFSPPLLMETEFLPDSYEDLLAPLSEIDTALMER
ncbi:AUGMIN subunit 6-like [Magnolia sinica]|uniref:AUGMIN subunit 6-like n=1 Tax=Magnolia sinica TaxID=86752 RepID=UPI00265AAB05|nr:AUGMIN subunit 6-like [Magnolia sinica]